MRNIWGLIADNFLLKLLSLVLAFFIWFYVHTERTQELTITVEVAFVPQANTILLSDKMKSFEILLEGPSEIIQTIPNPIELFEQCKTHSSTITIEEQKLDLPPGVTLVRKLPELSYHVEKTVTLSLSILVEATNSPVSGYMQGDLVFSPKTVSVTGPESVLNQDMTLSTEPVNLFGKMASFETLLRIRNSFKDPNIIIEDILVKVQVEIFPEEMEKDFEVPVTIVESPRFPFIVKSVVQDKVKISVKGPKTKIEKMTVEDILVLVNISYLKTKGIHTEIPTQVVLPDGITLVGTPPRVQVHLISPSESESFNNGNK